MTTIEKSDLTFFNNPVIEFTHREKDGTFRTHCIAEVCEVHDDETGVWVDVCVERTNNIELDVHWGIDLKDITDVIDPEEAEDLGLIDKSQSLHVSIC